MHKGGYLSAFPEELLDRFEAQKPVWAPYYTLHKIIQGLLDVHEHLGSESALKMAAKLSKCGPNNPSYPPYPGAHDLP